jgi:hypothetical protein
MPPSRWARPLFTLFAGSAIAAFGQENACLHRTIPVGVEDSNGVPIRGLTTADFRGKLRGNPVKILSIVPDDRPHRIVILLDASGSMVTKWTPTLISASALAETELPNTQMALLIFGTKAYEHIEFTQGQIAVAERLRQLRADATESKRLVHGTTALRDALLSGLQLLAPPTSADSLFLVSDGGDSSSHTHFHEVVDRLSASGVRLFVSLVVDSPGSSFSSAEELNGPSEVSELVRLTGGDLIWQYADRIPTSQKDRAQVAEAVNAFHQKIIHNFRLEVELPAPLNKGRGWDLKLAGGNKERWKKVRLTYPTELAPCRP